jgi:uncharacterized protein (TIGR01777 family)
METVLISGGTGLIGTALSEALIARNYKVIILTRRLPKNQSTQLAHALWDPEKGEIDQEAFKNADYIVHLAGANVAEGRWTAKRKKEIIDSRVKSGELIVTSLHGIPNKIKAVISASAIGFYGPDPVNPNPKPFVEEDRSSTDFLGSVVQGWETAIKPVSLAGKRLAIFRLGIVLSKKGGAYAEFRRPIQFGVTPILGSGKQVVSWIHIADVVNLFINAIEDEKYEGTFNGVAPHPVTNAILTRSITKHLHKIAIPVHVPAFALKLVLGEMSIEVLKSTTVSCEKLVRQGFTFSYPTIEKAIHALEASPAR